MFKGILRRRSIAFGLLAAIAALVCAPVAAVAVATTETVPGVVTVTLQTAAKTATAGSLAKTGDASALLILGIVALAVAAFCLAAQGRAFATAGAGVHALSAPVKNHGKLLAVMFALLGSLLLGLFATSTAGAAEGLLSAFKPTANIVVNEKGEVLSSDLTFANGCDFDIAVNGITVPSELNGLSAEASAEAVAAGKTAQSSWSGKSVSAETVKQLKANGGKLELAMDVSVTYNPLTPIDFADAQVDTSARTYTGEAFEPEVTIEGLTEGTDFTVAYQDNVNAGTASITVTGIGRYEGEQTYSFTINPAKLKSKMFSVDTANMVYDGTRKTPAVSSDVCGEGDYTVAYGENVNAGSAAGTVTIEGTGNYTGELTFIFAIAKAAPVVATPEPIVTREGKTLSDLALPTADNGAWSWNDATTSVGDLGERTFAATFTPTDASNYNSVSANVTVTVKVAFAMYSATDASLSFYLRTFVPVQGDYLDGRIVTEVYTGIETTGALQCLWSEYAASIKSVNICDDGIQPTRMDAWFKDCTKLASIDLTRLDTSKVTSMQWTFRDSPNLATIKLDGLDVSHVTSMYQMFRNCGFTTFTLPETFNTASVTDMSFMFEGNTKLTTLVLPSSFTTSNVTTMRWMFKDCTKLKTISGAAEFDTSNCSDMHEMFHNDGSLALDCSAWNIDKVGSAHNWFADNAPGVTSPAWK